MPYPVFVAGISIQGREPLLHGRMDRDFLFEPCQRLGKIGGGIERAANRFHRMDALSHAVGKIAGREMGSSIPQMGPSAVKFRRIQIGESLHDGLVLGVGRNRADDLLVD